MISTRVANITLPRLADALEALDAALAQPRRAGRDVRTARETGESRVSWSTKRGGCQTHLEDWPANGKDLRTALACGALTPEPFNRLR
jgi:hypothetical protein